MKTSKQFKRLDFFLNAIESMKKEAQEIIEAILVERIELNNLQKSAERILKLNI